MVAILGEEGTFDDWQGGAQDGYGRGGHGRGGGRDRGGRHGRGGRGGGHGEQDGQWQGGASLEKLLNCPTTDVRHCPRELRMT